jgi:hypothetical protein
MVFGDFQFLWLHYEIIILGLIFDVHISLPTTNCVQTCRRVSRTLYALLFWRFCRSPIPTSELEDLTSTQNAQLQVAGKLRTVHSEDWEVINLITNFPYHEVSFQNQNPISELNSSTRRTFGKVHAPLLFRVQLFITWRNKINMKKHIHSWKLKDCPLKSDLQFFSIRRKFCLITNGVGALHRLGDSGEVTEVSHRVGRR